MMRVLIVGANGQLGRDCCRAFRPRHDVTAMDLPVIDIAEADSVSRAVALCHPQIVVNTAAYTRVDDAEREPEVARRVNAVGPAVLAETCRRSGARLIHISTDYVFDGRRPVPQPWRETDAPAPLGVYGRTKLDGEQAVLDSGAEAAIFRTSWLYGRHGYNFLRTILRRVLAQPTEPLRVVDDQYGCPTWSWRLALQIAEWLDGFEPGLFHAAGEGHATWFVLARRFLDRLGLDAVIRPCTTADFPTSASRPCNSILENAALHASGRCVMMPWDEDLDAFADRVREDWIREISS